MNHGPKEFLSTAEAADALGVSVQTIIRWIDSGELAHVRLGSRYRVPAAEIDRLLTVQPARTGT